MNALLIRDVCEAALTRYQISGGSSQTDARDAARQIISELSALARANVMPNDITTLIRDMSFLAHMCASLHTVVVGPGAESTRRARYRLVAHCLTCLITNNENPNYSPGEGVFVDPNDSLPICAPPSYTLSGCRTHAPKLPICGRATRCARLRPTLATHTYWSHFGRLNPRASGSVSGLSRVRLGPMWNSYLHWLHTRLGRRAPTGDI